MADPDRLLQVLTNLFANAVHHTPARCHDHRQRSPRRQRGADRPRSPHRGLCHPDVPSKTSPSKTGTTKTGTTFTVLLSAADEPVVTPVPQGVP